MVGIWRMRSKTIREGKGEMVRVLLAGIIQRNRATVMVVVVLKELAHTFVRADNSKMQGAVQGTGNSRKS